MTKILCDICGTEKVYIGNCLCITLPEQRELQILVLRPNAGPPIDLCDNCVKHLALAALQTQVTE